MIRHAVRASAVLLLAACGSEGGSGLAYTQVAAAESFQPFTPSLSPDGTRLAWSAVVDGQAAIFVGNPDGSDAVRLTHGVWDTQPHWSPDGRWIAYYSDEDSDVWAVPSAGGEARQLTSGPASDFPGEWLPDGSAVVVYRSGAGATHTLAVPLDGGPARTLVPAAGGDQFVVLSPDGSQAAYDLHRGGASTIWVQELAGGPARQLTTEGLENALPTSSMWSPDSRHLVFVSRRTGTWDLWTANVETGELRQLTSDIRNDQGHRWSPDGRWIAFRSDRGGQWDIWIVPSAGGQALRVTNDLAVENNPQWSPDGRTLFYSVVEASRGLQVMPAAGGPGRELVAWSGYQAFDARVSPDGRTVLFTSNRAGNNDIWSVSFQGGEPAPFAASPLGDFDAQFSPDGTSVVFASERGGSVDLWIMPAAGGDARRLTEWPSAEAGPRWSSDGRWIAFTSDHEATAGSQRDVWMMPGSGGEPRRLTRLNGTASSLRWSPDGRSIYYVAGTATGARDLYRVPLTGGRPQALGASATIGGGDLSPDGSRWAYVSFERGWGFLEVLATGGGTPRRLTTDTSQVYHFLARWEPDGARVVVAASDFTNNTVDLMEVTWSQGAWRPLTQTPSSDESLEAFSPDGREMVISIGTNRSRIMSVVVERLLRM